MLKSNTVKFIDAQLVVLRSGKCLFINLFSGNWRNDEHDL